MGELPRLVAERRTGAERFRSGSAELSISLSDFWCWSTSDLLNNTTRGVLAEFLVATALEIPTSGVRDPWAAFDLQTSDGIKIEVKSAAFLQSWAQRQVSTILFKVAKTRAWSADTNDMASDPQRQADVFVFALLAHKKPKAAVNPLDVAQWQFFVLSSAALNARQRSQQSITLKSLETLASPTPFDHLASAVKAAFAQSRQVV